MKIPREIIPENAEKVEEYFKQSNLLLISGPNGCGKTYVVREFLDHFQEEKTLILDGINMSHRIKLMNNDELELAKIIREKEILFIDSAQRVPESKKIIDTLTKISPNLKIIIAYSTREVEEKNQIRVYPISFNSLKKLYPSTPNLEIIEEMMIYGSLPQVLLANDIPSKKKLLESIANTDILRDLFELENITNSKALMELLYYIAININKSLSINDISKHIGANPRTTKRYLELLEKHYIVHEHNPFNAGIHTEKTMFSRYYFYDLGIRNCLIENFASINMRNDTEQMWANFLVMEKHKSDELCNRSHSRDYESHFWETYSGVGLDLVEVDMSSNQDKNDGENISIFKFGFSDVRKVAALAPKIFTNKFNKASYQVINLDSFSEFLGNNS